MQRRLFLLMTLVFSVLFLFAENSGKTMGFPFSDMKLSQATWMYFFLEKVIVVLLAFVILTYEMDSIALMVFMIISMIDLLDYILFYGEPWFTGIPVTWNIIKVTIFGLSIIYEKWIKS